MGGIAMRYPFILVFSIIIMTGLFTAALGADSASLPSADKELVIDGHVSHDVGLLQNHVTNWGLIGSAPGTNTSFSHAPSGRWPGAGGDDYLWAAGLWIGGMRLGEALVSTAGWNSELYASEAAADTIYPAAMGLPASQRFPYADGDDDGDGLEDEDPPNGLDDDGDGAVDEDFAGIGDQAYRCVYRDDTELAQQNYPDHTPMGLEVIQETFQWDRPFLTNAIGYQFTITNDSPVAVDDVYLGMFSDFDAGQADNDQIGYWSGLVAASNGTEYPVSVAYIRDDDAVDPLPGFEGWVLLGHTTDPDGIAAPAEAAVHGFRKWSGNAAYPEGDPTNDPERYEVLSTEQFDAGSIHSNDWRGLLTSGPYASLAPGQSIQYQMGLVAGDSLEDMKANAAELMACFQGRDFERDGVMVHVPWIPLSDDIVAVEDDIEPEPEPLPEPRLQLSAHPNPFNPWCEIRFSLTEAGPTRVRILDMRGNLVRDLFEGQATAGVTSRVWDGKDNHGRDAASGTYRVQVRSENQALETRITLVR